MHGLMREGRRNPVLYSTHRFGQLEVAMADVGYCARVIPDSTSRALSVSVEQAAFAAFVVEQPALALDAAEVAAQRSARSQHAMARHDDRQRIAPVRGTDRA